MARVLRGVVRRCVLGSLGTTDLTPIQGDVRRGAH